MATRSRTVETYKDGVLVESRTETYDVPVEQVNEETIRASAAQALVTNRAFVKATKPTTAAAQASAAYDQTRALSQQVNGVIRLLLNQLDATD